VGSEGTLGIITQATLRVYGIPEAVSASYGVESYKHNLLSPMRFEHCLNIAIKVLTELLLKRAVV